MTAEDRRGVLERVKNLCAAKQLIDDLALCLRTSARSQNADVQATLDLISRQPHADQASSAVLSLTRALRNMDAEVSLLHRFVTTGSFTESIESFEEHTNLL